jgi:hypothetical protein
MRIALPVLVSLALAGASTARAAEPDNATLQQEVKALKEMVHELQQRVTVLEGRSPVPTQRAPLPQAAPAIPQPAPAVRQAAPAPQAPAPQAAPVAAAPLAASSGYISPEAALRASWSKVNREMDQGDVKKLLGEPSKKFLIDGRNVWYYYYPGTGAGSVFFTDAGRVSSSQSPLGWSW